MADEKTENTNTNTDSDSDKTTDSTNEKTSGDKAATITEEQSTSHPSWSTITEANLASAVGIRDMQGIMGNSSEIKARQHLLNVKKYKTEYKKPNPGKMPNNQDPFPVDLKIEEFEAHYPPTRIYELTTHVNGQVAAEAAMDVGNNAEKRLVKLENNMATMMRLIFRMGSRMAINCVYYGGQTPFEKYKTIRCLCDDRVSDGQNVQIDQCLYCTRYEPIDGQCYELLNDLGANVATILDDNQMSYSTIQEYVNLSRAEEYRTALDKATVDLSKVKTRNTNEKDFSTAWGQGLKMNWKYVPKEEQKTHINWRQSINDDGSNIGRLDSYPGNESNSGANIVGTNGSGMSNIMKQNKTAMDGFSASGKKNGDKVASIISSAQSITNQKDDCANCFKGEEYNTIKKKCSNSKADSLVIACVSFVTGNKDYDSLIKKYSEASTQIDTTNPAIIISAMMTSTTVFLGQVKSGSDSKDLSKRSAYGTVPRIDLPLKESTLSGGDATDNTKKDEDDDGVVLNWENRNSWMWTDFATRFVERATMVDNFQSLDTFPKACYLYCVVLPLLTNSRFDEDEYAFPFFDDQFEKYGMNYSSSYGMRDLGSGTKMHYGIDIGSEGGAEIHAVHDGTVKEDGNGKAFGYMHGICIDHGNGTYSRYLHCATMCVNAGQTVSRGDVIGTVGGWGQNGANTFDTHLHFELSPGDAITAKSSKDPLTYYPKFAGQVSKGDALKPA